jgi:hypothetical protein
MGMILGDRSAIKRQSGKMGLHNDQESSDQLALGLSRE